MVEKRKLQVEAILMGTVIDHIPSGQGIKILRKLRLLDSNLRITVGFNLPSKELGLKDIIKVENRLFNEMEANELAIFAPRATINVIDEYQVQNKFQMSTPEFIEGMFECPNSNCITHNEPVQTCFSLRYYKKTLQMKCKYCEKSFSKDIVAGI
ncbi:MAG: aspartate carbamoyltransferase regulatory subunit [Endozoicomonadaceae bacterium]|nr:aspartate carbamoyltransferase regulatory subunit [Endozoicomonadaceae bacterium]